MPVYIEYFKFYKKINRELNGNEMKVYINLISHRNREHTYAYPSQAVIAEEIGVSIDTVKRTVKTLAQKAYIEIKKQKRKAVGNYNIYYLRYIPKYDGKKEEETGNKEDLSNIDFAVEENSKRDSGDNIRLIEDKTGLRLTRWQKFIARKMDMPLLLSAIGNYIKKKGRTFTFLISIYTDILSKNNIFTEELAKLFKVDWTGSHSDFLIRQEEYSNRDEYDEILYSIYTPEEVRAIKEQNSSCTIA